MGGVCQSAAVEDGLDLVGRELDRHARSLVLEEQRGLRVPAAPPAVQSLLEVLLDQLGGAHRDHAATMVTLKKALVEALRQLQDQPLETLLETREDKILGYGKFKEIVSP